MGYIMMEVLFFSPFPIKQIINIDPNEWSQVVFKTWSTIKG